MAHSRSTYLGCVAVALAWLLTPPAAHAQASGTIAGVVTNAISGEPVANALVTASGCPDTARTDAEGSYTLATVPPGLVKVHAQIIGYLPITTPYYSVLPDSTTYVDFKLAPLTVWLDTLLITGERPSRTWAHGSQVVTKEQLPARGDILEALKGVVPGVEVSGRGENMRVISRQSHASMLFVVNGTVVRPPLTFYIDTQDVECVEVRRGYRAVGEFRPSLNAETYSGVILIWTRGSAGRKPPGCSQAG